MGATKSSLVTVHRDDLQWIHAFQGKEDRKQSPINLAFLFFDDKNYFVMFAKVVPCLKPSSSAVKHSLGTILGR